jgi:putative PIN family toxin of toxin-antitoxin system
VIRAVLDANVIVSGFAANSGTPAALIERWVIGEFVLVLSEHILDGAARAWGNPYYATRYTAGQAQETLSLLRRSAQLVIPEPSVHGVADDTEDDLVLGTAVAAEADYLVTGDKGLQRIGTYRGIPILSPRDFLSLLES